MKCITENILHNIINYKNSFILIFIISFSVFSSSVLAQEERTKERGIVIASCNALQYIKKIADADAKSSKDAVKIFYELANQGHCRRYNMPVAVDLGELEYSYVDSNNTYTEVWKLLKQNLWVLIVTEKNIGSEV
jgi:hypothetical protein|tara:strand:+ start:945 stop:1349 length:405 start_codon:yes stop_codon:yes gene_type:complete